ncbi:MAG: alkaline phosphatase D family protein [Giesbergeria sp.]
MRPENAVLAALDRRRFLALAAHTAAAGTLPRSAWGAPELRHDPFGLGVASGDPDPEGFVIWTRLLAQDAPRISTPLPVHWEVAEDTAFRRIVQHGSTIALPELAHSVHVEIAGLVANRWYHYRFHHGTATSPVGRARTAPARQDLPARLRLVFASCQRWEDGYYAAWEHVARDAPDLVLFLGDYIYEYATPADTSGLARVHALRHARTLTDFRDRYALHKSDRQLQAAHATCPWVVTWDDHEVQNDWAGDTGRWDAAGFASLRSAGFQAFYEHMPLGAARLAGPGFSALHLYRRLAWGQLAQLHVLDGRQHRDRQACRRPRASGAGAVQPDICAELTRPERSFLGTAQERWIDAGLKQDGARGTRWSVLAQQTLFAPRHYPSGLQSTDTWDGYPAARARLIASVARYTPGNTVVLGGDIHQNYVCRIPKDTQDVAGPAIASEFCGTSITSRSGTTQQKLDAIVRHNPHVLLARCGERGYGIAEITPRLWTTRLKVLDDPLRADSSTHTLANFVVERGRPGPIRQT